MRAELLLALAAAVVRREWEHSWFELAAVAVAPEGSDGPSACGACRSCFATNGVCYHGMQSAECELHQFVWCGGTTPEPGPVPSSPALPAPGPSPTPTPGPPTPAPTPPRPAPGPPEAPLPALPALPAEVRGYFSWTWTGTAGPPDANLGIVFSGFSRNALAKSGGSPAKTPGGPLKGLTFLSVGGGTGPHGHWTRSILEEVNADLPKFKAAGFAGVCYDVEAGDGTAALEDFEASFAKAHTAGLLVLVTVSHTAPWGLPNRSELGRGFAQSSSIDVLAPQLYTNGETLEPTASAGVPFDTYADFKGLLVPAVPRRTDAAAAAVVLPDAAGYITWLQDPQAHGPPASSAVSASDSVCPKGQSPFSDTPSPGVCSCGVSWAAANVGGARCEGSSARSL